MDFANILANALSYSEISGKYIVNVNTDKKYKLKNINDIEYKKQLNIYMEYISSITNKKVYTYLYSIIDNILTEV